MFKFWNRDKSTFDSQVTQMGLPVHKKTMDEGKCVEYVNYARDFFFCYKPKYCKTVRSSEQLPSTFIINSIHKRPQNKRFSNSVKIDS